MAKTGMRLKTSKGFNSKFAGEEMTRSVEAALVEFSPKVVEQFNKFVADWSDASRPTFAARPRRRPNGAGLTYGVQPVGTKIQKERWRMVDVKGRKGGKTITAKSPANLETVKGKYGSYKTLGYLRFRETYHPKTSSGAGYGNPQGGQRSGKYVRRYWVRQGAVEPRGFSKEYLPKFKKGFRKAVRRGYRRAFNKLTSGPKI